MEVHIEKYNKTKCVPLGNTRYDDTLKYLLTTNYGKEFIINEFKALGITFDNFSSPSKIMEQNYVAKMEKATIWTGIWSKRDLSLIGKVTILKGMVFSQFSILAVPLISPLVNILKQ